MADYKSINTTFINPYNFVPVKEKPAKIINVEDNNKEGLHTGCLHCSLTVKTPLAIPDVANAVPDNSVKEHMIYHAFRINGQLAIPGSSIRGMLRSVYEAATNSCMSTIDPNEHITKRSDLGPTSPCVLRLGKDGKWELYDAERIALVGEGENYRPLVGEYKYKSFEVLWDGKEKYVEASGEKLYFGQEVKITADGPGHKKINKRTGKAIEVWDGKSVSSIAKSSNTGCYLYLGEAISNKHAESVFEITNVNKTINAETIKKAMKGLEETLKLYRTESVNRNLSTDKPKEKHYGYRGYERAKRNGAIPLWYKKEGNSLKLSMAAIGRIAFDNDMEAIANGHAPCVSRKQLCPACAVFGMVGIGKDNNGTGSLIRVTDAVGTGETTTDVTLKELGSPRTSYLKFYSENGKGYDDSNAVIRGRKFYWHIPAAGSDSSIYSAQEKTKRNATFELVNTGSEFKFDVFYDRLTEEQLKMLLWVIQLPNKRGKGKSLMHKLGHGKPLGLGSVELKIESNMERCFSNAYEIKESTISLSEREMPGLLNLNTLDKLTMMLEYDMNSEANISYPEIILSKDLHNMIAGYEQEGYRIKENIKASHQWFSRNKEVLPENKIGLSLLALSNVKEPIFDNGKAYNGDFERIGAKSKKSNSNEWHGRNAEKFTGEEIAGVVKRFTGEKGYGFIEYDNGKSIFFHISQFSRDDATALKTGSRVKFTIGEGKKGKEAKNCRIKA